MDESLTDHIRREKGHDEYQALASRDVVKVRQAVEQDVRYVNITIIEGIGASQLESEWSRRASRRSLYVTSGP